MNPFEKRFLNTFVTVQKRDRYLELLMSKNGRKKLCQRLAHDFIDDLKNKHVHSIQNPPEKIKKHEALLLNAIHMKNPEHKCAIISEDSNLDGKFLPLETARYERREDMGTVIIVAPEQLAYYYGEEPNSDYILIK